MGKSLGREFKRIGKDIGEYSSGKKFKDEFNRATGKTKKEAGKRDAKKAKAKGDAMRRGQEFAESGADDQKSLLNRKGRKSTRVVGREKLGGRSLL